MGAAEITQFLNHLATNGKVAASTQNQALNALVFLYGQVLDRDPGTFEGLVRAKRPRRLPVVLTREEVKALLVEIQGLHKLQATLLYGTGMRLMEALRLRVQDLDFDQSEILIRAGKGNKDRRTMFPEALKDRLRAHLAEVRRLHLDDLAKGLGRVWMPDALDSK